MAQTTFTGPVVSLNGFIGGANENGNDTAQGGKVSWTVGTNTSTVTIATGPRAGETLSAVGNDGAKVSWTVLNASTVQIASGTRSGEQLSAVGNDGCLIYVSNGNAGVDCYAMSNGTQWIKLNVTNVAISAS